MGGGIGGGTLEAYSRSPKPLMKGDRQEYLEFHEAITLTAATFGLSKWKEATRCHALAEVWSQSKKAIEPGSPEYVK